MSTGASVPNPFKTHCSFETVRLSIVPWHEAELPANADLAGEVASVLSACATAGLPDDWNGSFSAVRAATWITERDAEAVTLLIRQTDVCMTIGLLILGITSLDEPSIDLRIGYLLTENASGQGFATELVAGLAGWARIEPSVHSLTGGVDPANKASAQVLRKNGFGPVPGSGSTPTVFRLSTSRRDLKNAMT